MGTATRPSDEIELKVKIIEREISKRILWNVFEFLALAKSKLICKRKNPRATSKAPTSRNVLKDTSQLESRRFEIRKLYAG